MGSATSTVVPANRLGQLLAEARLRQGTDLEELSFRSEFTVGELSDFEAGHRVLNDVIVQKVTGLYEIDCGPIIPQRAELTIDLTENVLSASGHALPLASAAHDHILERYLSLVYVLRNSEPGTPVPLRDEDVAILAASLAERAELVEEQLLATMYTEPDSVRGLVQWLRQRLWVPSAGAIVGAVSLGTLVMVTSDGSASATATTDLPDNDDVASGGSTILLPSRLSPSRASVPSTTSSTAADTTLAPTSTPVAASVTPFAVDTASAARASGTLGAQAEALLPFDWQAVLPEWTITYHETNREFRGLTFPYDQSIELYVRDDDSAATLSGILAHEIGHAIDVTHLDDRQRSRWQETRSIEESQWWPDAYASDFETGAGDFAEAFAYWAVRDPSASRIAHQPTSSQLIALEALLSDIL